VGWASFLAFGTIIVLLAKPVGWWLFSVYERQPLPVLDRVVGPVERAIYRVCGVDPTVESRWTGYAMALMAFNALGIVALFIQLRFQHLLPTGAGFEGMSPTVALNTAVSFVTNTNWQTYAGETGTSPLSQMAGLTLQQFLSASTGMAVAAALIRGFARDSARKVGNFWVDLTRSWLYVLLPVSIVLAIGYVALGVPQTLGGTVTAQTLEGATQTIPIGPLASMEAIKELGTNGGGYFNANSAHPFEGPTPLAAYIQMIVIFSIPAGFTWMFGKSCGDTRQGWAVFATMMLLFSIGAGLVYSAEQQAPPLLVDAGADVTASEVQSGGNMEGKETRFGVAESSLYAAVTTAASNGAVIAMHDSLTPLAGGMVLLNMLLGEVVFGGVGVGLAGMLIFAILAVFIAGLMVGRTPEYVGKKIESYEVRMAMLAVLAVAGSILALTAVASVVPSALDGRLNAGPHGFTEILYAFASGAGNNGSAFGGLAAASPFYAIGVSVAMFIGRYLFIVPVLAIAGSLAAKKRVPPSAGTLPTTGGLFVGLLAGVVLIVGALTFFPALALGPLVEHFCMLAGKLF
jgi:K+-transporting ATPase ATPase A chain